MSRGFAGPGASSTPLDRDHSFHGTHVAGVIAGVKTDVEAGRHGHLRRGAGRLPSRGRRPRGSRAARAHRQLPRLQRPRSGAARRLLLGEQPGDRRRLRGGRARRDGHHQLLGRRPAGGSADGRPHRGGREHRPRRRRADHLGRKRPRLLRARDGRLARNRAGRDQRRCGRERARLRPVDHGARARRRRADPLRRRPTAFRPRGSRPTSGSSTSGRSGAPTGSSATARSPRARCGTRSRS